MSEIPIACSLSAPEKTARVNAFAEHLFTGVDRVEELPDGFAFRFPKSEPWLGDVLELVKLERACCPFLTFEICFEPAEGPLWLRLRGGDGTKEFIRAELAPLLRASA